MTPFEVRGPDRVDELLALARTSSEFVELSAEELLLSCHERGGVVLAAADVGAVAVAVGRGLDGELLAAVRLLVVDAASTVDTDEARHSLLDAAEAWATERSATRLVIGGGLPFSLWPGAPLVDPVVDVAIRRGYVRNDEWASFRVPVTFRAEPPEGVSVRRAVRDEDVALVIVESSARWPRRSDEIARALDHGTCHVAVMERDGVDALVGLSTHSIARAGWTGPILVVDDHRRRGIGHSLLAQVCRDLMIAEFPHVIVGDASDGSGRGFLEAAGAIEDARFVHVERTLDV